MGEINWFSVALINLNNPTAKLSTLTEQLGKIAVLAQVHDTHELKVLPNPQVISSIPSKLPFLEK